MEEQMQSLREHATREIVQLPEDQRTIDSKWIFTKDLEDRDNVIRYKARLLAQGFNQKYCMDYDQVFAPVVRRNLMVQHVDAKIYMKQPAGFTTGCKNDVCCLRKSL